MNINNIAILGLYGLNFSSRAYDLMARHFSAPRAEAENSQVNNIKENKDIIPFMLRTGGYGALAVETKHEGRIDHSMNSFTSVLDSQWFSTDINPCRIDVIGSARMKVKFALLARPGVQLRDIKMVIAHPRSFGPCRMTIEKMGWARLEANSNGEAGMMVASGATNPMYSNSAAIAPAFAAESLGLNVLVEDLQEGVAETTFLLFGPRIEYMDHATPSYEGEHKLVIVFRLPDARQSLARFLQALAVNEHNGINLSYIHSVFYGNGQYDFIVVGECGGMLRGEVRDFIKRAKKKTERCVPFGPFPVISVS